LLRYLAHCENIKNLKYNIKPKTDIIAKSEGSSIAFALYITVYHI